MLDALDFRVDVAHRGEGYDDRGTDHDDLNDTRRLRRVLVCGTHETRIVGSANLTKCRTGSIRTPVIVRRGTAVLCNAKIDSCELLRQGEECREEERPEAHSYGSENGSRHCPRRRQPLSRTATRREQRTVGRDGTVSHHDSHDEAALADDLREHGISEVLRACLLATALAPVTEGTVLAGNSMMSRMVHKGNGRGLTSM